MDIEQQELNPKEGGNAQDTAIEVESNPPTYGEPDGRRLVREALDRMPSSAINSTPIALPKIHAPALSKQTAASTILPMTPAPTPTPPPHHNQSPTSPPSPMRLKIRNHSKQLQFATDAFEELCQSNPSPDQGLLQERLSTMIREGAAYVSLCIDTEAQLFSSSMAKPAISDAISTVSGSVQRWRSAHTGTMPPPPPPHTLQAAAATPTPIGRVQRIVPQHNTQLNEGMLSATEHLPHAAVPGVSGQDMQSQQLAEVLEAHNSPRMATGDELEAELMDVVEDKEEDEFPGDDMMVDVPESPEAELETTGVPPESPTSGSSSAEESNTDSDEEPIQAHHSLKTQKSRPRRRNPRRVEPDTDSEKEVAMREEEPGVIAEDDPSEDDTDDTRARQDVSMSASAEDSDEQDVEEQDEEEHTDSEKDVVMGELQDDHSEEQDEDVEPEMLTAELQDDHSEADQAAATSNVPTPSDSTNSLFLGQHLQGRAATPANFSSGDGSTTTSPEGVSRDPIVRQLFSRSGTGCVESRCLLRPTADEVEALNRILKPHQKSTWHGWLALLPPRSNHRLTRCAPKNAGSKKWQAGKDHFDKHWKQHIKPYSAVLFEDQNEERGWAQVLESVQANLATPRIASDLLLEDRYRSAWHQEWWNAVQQHAMSSLLSDLSDKWSATTPNTDNSSAVAGDGTPIVTMSSKEAVESLEEFVNNYGTEKQVNFTRNSVPATRPLNFNELDDCFENVVGLLRESWNEFQKFYSDVAKRLHDNSEVEPTPQQLDILQKSQYSDLERREVDLFIKFCQAAQVEKTRFPDGILSVMKAFAMDLHDSNATAASSASIERARQDLNSTYDEARNHQTVAQTLGYGILVVTSQTSLEKLCKLPKYLDHKDFLRCLKAGNPWIQAWNAVLEEHVLLPLLAIYFAPRGLGKILFDVYQSYIADTEDRWNLWHLPTASRLWTDVIFLTAVTSYLGTSGDVMAITYWRALNQIDTTTPHATRIGILRLWDHQSRPMPDDQQSALPHQIGSQEQEQPFGQEYIDPRQFQEASQPAPSMSHAEVEMETETA